jgi:histidinol-phosphate aminotransferase
LDNLEEVNVMIRETVKERSELVNELLQIEFIEQIYPSDANFVLAKMKEATEVYNFLKEQGNIVRNRSQVILCEDCLRITVGTPEQDRELVEVLKTFRISSVKSKTV